MIALRALALLTLISVVAVPAFAQQDRAAQLVAEGEEALARGDVRLAEQRFSEALAADRGFVPARLALGTLAYDAGQMGSAEDHFRAALRAAPDNLEARYYQGMVKREQGRSRPPLTGWLLDEFKDSRDHFEFVIARDSTFRDVLYQYALLQQYRGDEKSAVSLAFRQLALKPEDPSAAAGFARMVRMYASTHGESSDSWLRGLPEAYRTLVEAEVARRADRMDEARSLLLELLQQPDGVQRPLVHLLLARVFVAGNYSDAAEVQFWSAVDAIETPADAAVVMEEVKYVLTDEEFAAFDSLATPEAYQEFFRKIWARRDPMPAAASNARLVEHLRRLNVAEKSYEYYNPRSFFNDPDINSALRFGRIYELNHSLNDKGLVFIRHGPPDARVFTSDDNGGVSRALQQMGSPGGVGQGMMEPLPVESWRYYAAGDVPELIFHFATRAGGNWRLISAPMWLQALHDLRDWGPVYSEAFQAMAEGAALEIPRLNMQMQREAQEDVAAGLQTDRHSWSEDVIPLQIPTTVAAFRGPERATLVEVFYGIPTRPISEHVTTEEPVQVEVGLSVHDSEWNKVINRRDRKRVLPSSSASDLAGGAVRFTIEPDTFTLSMYVKPEDTPLIGGWNAEYVFPDFSTGQFMMSDLLLASLIGPPDDASPFMRGDVNVIPSFSRRFRSNSPVYVYFEIYNLALDDTDHTSYVTEIELRPLEARRGGLLGLFSRSDRPVLSLRTEGSGTVISPVEYTELDMADVQAGEYQLIVRVHDAISGTTFERSQVLELVAL